jgi:hypothetical protein
VSHVTPFILAAGLGVQGSSLGYHAYSLRVDNISNQWLQEESTLVWIPPYSLGVVVRLWGTAVALLIPSAPQGQFQQAPITGEYSVAVFSDEFRTENPGVPIRQFTLVQSVSDLTEGPQPALPPVGVDRIYADSNGRIHHLHSDGTDLILVDPSQVGVVTSGMILDGTIVAADMAAGAAAGNVGALGGVLNGTLPNPGMAAGAAAANVGSLGGVLTGTLPNPGLAAGAAQALVGAYTGLPGFSTSTTGTWIGTPVNVTFSSRAVNTRLECQVVVSHTTANAQVFAALYVDGTPLNVRLHTFPSAANQPFTLTLIDYTIPAAGGHTIQLYLLNNTAGTLSTWAGINGTLWVTEQRA